MLLEIKKHPFPLLKKRCEEVKTVNGEIRALIRDMFQTMYHNNGIGLASNQVGHDLQLAVIDVGDGKRVIINPKIIKKQGKETSEEGCLSLPHLFLKIKRAKRIEVEALNEKGENVRIKGEGLLAFCLQHEIDHLNGVLIKDRIGFLHKLRNLIK